jgi:hypothetical protein
MILWALLNRNIVVSSFWHTYIRYRRRTLGKGYWRNIKKNPFARITIEHIRNTKFQIQSCTTSTLKRVKKLTLLGASYPQLYPMKTTHVP